MKHFNFLIQGGAKNPYSIKVYYEENGMINDARCSCPAGKSSGLICKHIMAVFAGDIENLVSGNFDEFLDVFDSTSHLEIKDIYYDEYLIATSQHKKTKASKKIRAILNDTLLNRKSE